jgi:hypothetical protein
MHNGNLLEKLKAITAVGSGDWLGCWLRIVWIILFVAWLVVIIKWLRASAAYNKAYREYQQSRREYHNPTCQSVQSSGQINERVRLVLKPLTGNLGNLAQVREQNAHVIHNRPNLFRLAAHSFGALQHTYQATAHFLAMFFGGHKSNKRKQPNEKS